MFMRIAYHPCDPRQSRNFLRCSLRIAAGHKDLGLGIFAMDAADRCPRVMIG
jgi:hypothetical protein